MNCLAPGALYGDPTYDGDRSPGGTLNYAARQFILREDMLPAPLFALSFQQWLLGGHARSFATGESTVEETKLTKDVMTDARFQFGAFGAWQTHGAPIEFGFQFPGTMSMYPFGPNAPKEPRWIRRYHPIAQGVYSQLRGEFSLRRQRVISRRDAKLMAMGVEHVEARGHPHRCRTDASRSDRSPGRPGRHH